MGSRDPRFIYGRRPEDWLPSVPISASGGVTAGDVTTAIATALAAVDINTTAPITGGGNLSADRTLVLNGTKAQFNAACSDGDFLYVGDITQYTDEMARDALGAALVAGTNITITVNDGADTITIDASGGYTDEQAQDAVGGMLTDTATIDFTYNDGAATVTADVKAGSIGTTQLITADVNEIARDAVGAALTAATGIAIDVDDAANTITIRQGPLTVETVAGASYTFVLADAGKHKRFTNAGAVPVTVPANASVAFPVGTRIRGTTAGAGQTTLTPDTGVTLNSRGGALKSAGQYAVWEIEKVATNEWDVLGDVTT